MSRLKCFHQTHDILVFFQIRLFGTLDGIPDFSVEHILVPQVLDRLGPLQSLGGRDDAGIFTDLLREKGNSLAVRHDRADILDILAGILRRIEEVDKGVGQLDVLGACRDDQLVAGRGESLFREGESDFLRRLGHDLGDIAVVAVADEKLAAGDTGLVLLVVELGNEFLPLQNQVAGLFEFGLICGVDAVAQVFEGSPDGLAHIIQQGNASFERLGLQTGPGVDRGLADLVLAVGEPREGDGVGDVVGEVRIDQQAAVGRIEVFHHIRELALVELQNQVVLGHEHDLVGARENDIVPAAARLDLGVHRLVGIKGVDFDPAVVLLFKGLHQIRIHIVRPGIEVKGRRVVATAGHHSDCCCQDQARSHFKHTLHAEVPFCFCALALWVV